MNVEEKVLYTGKTLTTGGRDGVARSSDGELDVRLAMFGSGGKGTNPEQLFAAGWSACFLGSMRLAAGKRKMALPAEASIDAEVDLVMQGEGYHLSARLAVNLPGVEPDVAHQLVNEAHEICPYSKGTRGNVKVVTTLV